MTRAQFSLTITYSGVQGSRFIGEMDPKDYDAVGLPMVYDSGTGNNIERRKKDVNIELPPIAKVPLTPPAEKGLKEFFEDRGLEVYDKRPSGGALWVVGDRETLLIHIKEASKVFGAYGNFSKGGRTTKNRPAWFTSCKK